MKSNSLLLKIALAALIAGNHAFAQSVSSAGWTIFAGLPAASGIAQNDSQDLVLRGTYWNGTAAVNLDCEIINLVNNSSNYLLSFRTNSTDRLVIDQAGNVGIGTTAPRSITNVPDNLDVRGGLSIGQPSQYNGAIASADSVFINIDATNTGTSKIFQIQKGSYSSTDTGSLLTVQESGNVGIGTGSPGYKLQVAGSVRATSFISDTSTYADVVFSPSYRLASLSETEASIKRDGHLPGVPSESDVRSQGMDLAKMEVILLQKVEELTLHQIDLERKNQAQEREIHALRTELAAVK